MDANETGREREERIMSKAKPLLMWPTEPEMRPEEPQRFLKLQLTSAGDIAVAVVDEAGDHITLSWLVIINKQTGAVRRCRSINPKLGLELEDGRVKLECEERKE